jgi:FdhD protein
MEQRSQTIQIHRFANQAQAVVSDDQVAVEEPLEIRLDYGSEKRVRKSISITMRTPGNDFELAAGFLYNEQIIQDPDQIERIRYCGLPIDDEGRQNVVRVVLRSDAEVDLQRLERHFYTTSSCGVCGKASISALQLSHCPLLPSDGPTISAQELFQLPERLRAAQEVFDSTGGLHAAALFRLDGTLEALREDVGRHNAVDKLIGMRLIERNLDFRDRILFLSGRISFELTQKALVAGIPIVAAVGAPSSLAIQLAEEFGMSLVGFVRGQRLNVYSGAWRIQP